MFIRCGEWRSWRAALLTATVIALTVCPAAAPPAATAAQTAIARQPGFGTIRVTVENQLGDPLFEVTVALVDETDGKTVATLTTTSPTFEFAAVRPGPYGVRGTKAGFAFFYHSVEVRDLETTSQRVVMKVADVTEKVTVIGRETPTDRAGEIRLYDVQPLPVRVCDAGGCVMPATKLLGDARPTYPSIALTSGVEGVVTINATIDTEGAVREPAVLRSVDEALDAAALEAISQWRFIPARLNGVAVAVTVIVTVDFRLTATALAR